MDLLQRTIFLTSVNTSLRMVRWNSEVNPARVTADTAMQEEERREDTRIGNTIEGEEALRQLLL